MIIKNKKKFVKIMIKGKIKYENKNGIKLQYYVKYIHPSKKKKEH